MAVRKLGEDRSAFWRRVYFDEDQVIHFSTWISSLAAPSCGKDFFPLVAPKPVGGDPGIRLGAPHAMLFL